MRSARLQNVTSSCTNLAKQSEQLSVLRYVLATCQRSDNFLRVRYVSDALAGTKRKNQQSN